MKERRRLTREQAESLAQDHRFEVKNTPYQWFTMRMNADTALNLLGQLQLALRHPRNKGPMADEARELARAVEEWLRLIGPATTEIARLGWDESIEEPDEGDHQK